MLRIFFEASHHVLSNYGRPIQLSKVIKSCNEMYSLKNSHPNIVQPPIMHRYRQVHAISWCLDLKFRSRFGANKRNNVRWNISSDQPEGNCSWKILVYIVSREKISNKMPLKLHRKIQRRFSIGELFLFNDQMIKVTYENSPNWRSPADFRGCFFFILLKVC